MTTWFTSDQHWGHDKIIEYCNRPFVSGELMDEEMIERWNSVVDEKDTVWHIGDFTLSGMEYFLEVVNVLNGTINIVPGGHDHRWMKGFESVPPGWRIPATEKVFLWPTLHNLQLKRKGEKPIPIVLCHYPMLSWDRSHYGSLHLHGHVHNTWDDTPVAKPSGDTQLPPGLKRGVRINMSVDIWDFYPAKLEVLLDMAGISGTLRT